MINFFFAEYQTNDRGISFLGKENPYYHKCLVNCSIPFSNKKLSNWRLYTVIFPEEGILKGNFKEVSSKLYGLLYFSTMNYSPALALARHKIGSLKKEFETLEDFEQDYYKILKFYINNQAQSNFFISEKMNNGYESNEFHWIIGFNQDKGLITYVSQDDYFIYQANMKKFNLPLDKLNLLKEEPGKILNAEIY